MRGEFPMNINQLAIFHAVAEESSVTRAAERLHISQPAVSKQLRELEKSLGMALFHRLSKGVKLTEGGLLLRGYARRIFALEIEAERALAALRGLERGLVRVGASTTIGMYLLPQICARFRERFPGVDLTLEIANTHEIQKRLSDNTLDLGFSEGEVNAHDLSADVFAWDEIVVVAPPHHALLSEENVTAKRLGECEIIAREAGSGTRAVVEAAFAEQGITLRPRLSLGSTEAVKRAVVSGAGIALVSRLAIEQELHSGALCVVPIEDLMIRRPLHRLKLKGKYEGRAVREFVRLLRDLNREPSYNLSE